VTICIEFAVHGACQMKRVVLDLSLSILRQDSSVIEVTIYGLDWWVLIPSRSRDLSICHLWGLLSFLPRGSLYGVMLDTGAFLLFFFFKFCFDLIHDWLVVGTHVIYFEDPQFKISGVANHHDRFFWWLPTLFPTLPFMLTILFTNKCWVCNRMWVVIVYLGASWIYTEMTLGQRALGDNSQWLKC
jgi:hypothetical protein